MDKKANNYNNNYKTVFLKAYSVILVNQNAIFSRKGKRKLT